MSQPGSSTAIDYNPFDHEIDARVHEVWRRMRDEAPIYRNDQYDFWALSRYDDVLPAMVDTQRFSSTHATTLDMMGPDIDLPPMMIFMDPPEHSWHRKLVSRAFTVRTVTNLRARVTKVCNDLLDAVQGTDEFDFLEDYGSVIPPTMILALLGFPEGIERDFRDHVNATFEIGSDGTRSTESLASVLTSDGLIQGEGFNAEVFAMVPEFLADRRKSPKDDLMSVLANTQLEEDGKARYLDDSEIIGFIMMLSVAGTETVGRLLGWVATLLDRHPDQRTLLVEEPDRIENAIEECLRFEAPSPVNGRWVMEDVEFHGQTIPKDSKLLLLNGSANRDERHFVDADRFDITRRIDRHLSFGYGAHFCVGAALARLEGQVALAEFLKRHPRWEVDHDRCEMVHTSTVRGYSKVPIRV